MWKRGPSTQLLHRRAVTFMLFKFTLTLFLSTLDVDGYLPLSLLVLWFTVLLFMSSLAALSQLRCDAHMRMEATPLHLHVRLVALNALVLGSTALLLYGSLSLGSLFEDGIHVALVLSTDLVNLLLGTVKVAMEYALTTLDLRAGPTSPPYLYWRTQGTFLLDFLQMAVTLAHYVHIQWLSGLSFSLVTLVLLMNIKSVASRMMDKWRRFHAYRHIRSQVEAHLTPATHAEAEAAGDCAICMEPQVGPGARPSSTLQCRHTMHTACVTRWLLMPDSHGTCPVCRAPAVPQPPSGPPAGGAQGADPDPHAAQPPQQAPQGAPGLRHFQWGPLHIQYGGGGGGPGGGMLNFNLGAPAPRVHAPRFDEDPTAHPGVRAVLEVLPHLSPAAVLGALHATGGSVDAVVTLGLDGGIPAAPPTPQATPTPRESPGELHNTPLQRDPESPTPRAPDPAPVAVSADDDASSDEESIRAEAAEAVRAVAASGAPLWDVYRAQVAAMQVQARRLYFKAEHRRHRARSAGKRASDAGQGSHSAPPAAGSGGCAPEAATVGATSWPGLRQRLHPGSEGGGADHPSPAQGLSEAARPVQPVDPHVHRQPTTSTAAAAAAADAASHTQEGGWTPPSPQERRRLMALAAQRRLERAQAGEEQ